MGGKSKKAGGNSKNRVEEAKIGWEKLLGGQKRKQPSWHAHPVT